MATERMMLTRRDLPDALADECARAGERPVATCVNFVRAAAAVLAPGFAIPTVRVTEQEPAESGRGDHNGSYYYDGRFREGDDRRAIVIETSYNRPEEMMYPEPHSWTWVYTVAGLTEGSALCLRCSRDAMTGSTTGLFLVLEVTGGAAELAAVGQAFREHFAKPVTPG